MDTIAFGVGVRKVSWPDGYADDSNLQADYELAGELQAFQSEYRADGTVEVVIRYDARLVQGRTQRILASKRFEVRQPLADKQVAGFGQACDLLTGQVVDWAIAQAGSSTTR